MGKHIATLLHQALDIAEGDARLDEMSKSHHFVIDKNLMALMTREDVSDSMIAMVQAGIAKLPYPNLLIEFESNESTRAFVLLNEIIGGWTARAALITHALAVKVSENVSKASINESGLHIENSADASEARFVAFSIGVALVVMNMRAISREVIVVEALNKKRERTGKPRVPVHTVLRIGTVTLSDGREVSYGSAEHRHMKIHMRKGHARNQPFGPGLTETKLIYIQPVFVGIGKLEEVQPVKRIITA